MENKNEVVKTLKYFVFHHAAVVIWPSPGGSDVLAALPNLAPIRNPPLQGSTHFDIGGRNGENWERIKTGLWLAYDEGLDLDKKKGGGHICLSPCSIS